MRGELLRWLMDGRADGREGWQLNRGQGLLVPSHFEHAGRVVECIVDVQYFVLGRRGAEE